ncbi:hypothetical protein BU16DRAFT_541930 [Lophium mytilinum]|uniref:Uncharacterized protein n=1 Tax=Lophium mytilinum TaxID=390894 RepID=A0A6A6QJ30_9PEZI|nr:hypothetical protein BU16DRAFT_541930 [Lophium mytilinum]
MSGPAGYPPQGGYNTGQPQRQMAHPNAQGFQYSSQANAHATQTPRTYQNAGQSPMAHPNVQGFQFPTQAAHGHQYGNAATQTPQYSSPQLSPQSHTRNRHTAMGGGQPVFAATQQWYQGMGQGQGQGGAVTGAASRIDPRFPGYGPVPQIPPQWRQ